MLTDINYIKLKVKFLEDYTGDFELVGSMFIGDLEQKTDSRFKSVDDLETYINAIDKSLLR